MLLQLYRDGNKALSVRRLTLILFLYLSSCLAMKCEAQYDGSLDQFSIQCIQCHIDYGDMPYVNVSSQGMLLNSNSGGNHHIGIYYLEASLTGSFRDISEINDAIILPEGRLSCISCHINDMNMQHVNHGDLVINNTYSKLCLECHDI